MPFKTREAKRKEQAQIMAKNKWSKGYETVAKYKLCSYIGTVMQATLTPPP